MHVQLTCDAPYPRLHSLLRPSLVHLSLPHGEVLWQTRLPRHIAVASTRNSVNVFEASCTALATQNGVYACLGPSLRRTYGQRPHINRESLCWMWVSLIYFLRIRYLISTHTTVPNTILRSPRNHVFRPDPELRRRICLYFVEVYRCELAYIRGKLPDTMTKWGKVRIANGGDKMRCKCAVSDAQAANIRDSSFVRVSKSFYTSCYTI